MNNFFDEALPRIVIADDKYGTNLRTAGWAEVEKIKKEYILAYREDLCRNLNTSDPKQKAYYNDCKNANPIWVPMAADLIDPSGGRKSKNLNSNGLGCLDTDKIPFDPVEYYNAHIRGREEELHIIYIGLSFSGAGYHIIYERNRDESITDGQVRIASALGLLEWRDDKCVDLSRSLYITSEAKTLYVQPEGFYFRNQKEKKEIINHFNKIDKIKVTKKIVSKINEISMDMNNLPITPTKNTQTTTDTQVPTEYNGIPLEALMAAILRQYNIPVPVTEGNRANAVFYLTLNLKGILTPKQITEIVPTYGLDDHEYTNQISSGLKSEYKSGAKLQAAIAESKAAMPEVQEVAQYKIDMDAEHITRPSAAVPELMGMLLEGLPEEFYTATAFAMASVLGTYLTDIRFKYPVDHHIHSFSFFVVLTAPQASGKSIVYDRVRLARKVLEDHDRHVAQQETAYKKEMKKIEQLGIWNEAPEEPAHDYRLLGVKCSEAKAVIKLYNANGKRLLMCATEISSMVNNRKHDYALNDDIIKEAFDDEEHHIDNKQDDTPCVPVPVRINFWVSGTPRYLEWFRQDVEDGKTTRVIFTHLPERFGWRLPDIEEYTPIELAKIETMTKDLMQQQGMRYSPIVEEAILKWIDEKHALGSEIGSKAVLTLLRRNAVIGYRMGMLYCVLFGCARTVRDTPINEEKEQAAADWAVYFAEYNFRRQMTLFGDDYENIDYSQNIKKSSTYKILEMVGEEFTLPQLQSACDKIGKYPHTAHTLISRWEAAKKITKINPGNYKKNA